MTLTALRVRIGLQAFPPSRFWWTLKLFDDSALTWWHICWRSSTWESGGRLARLRRSPETTPPTCRAIQRSWFSPLVVEVVVLMMVLMVERCLRCDGDGDDHDGRNVEGDKKVLKMRWSWWQKKCWRGDDGDDKKMLRRWQRWSHPSLEQCSQPPPPRCHTERGKNKDKQAHKYCSC